MVIPLAADRIVPLPAAEMREWIGQRGHLVAAAASQRETRRQLEQKCRLAAGHRTTLTEELQRLGQPAPTTEPSLAELIMLLEAVIEQHRENARKAADAADLVNGLEEQIPGLVLTAERSLAARDGWVSDWADEVATLGLDPTLKPEQVGAVVEALNELFTTLDQAADLQNPHRRHQPRRGRLRHRRRRSRPGRRASAGRAPTRRDDPRTRPAPHPHASRVDPGS